ncbi:Formate-dependent nitrite reductase, membrane component NrfD [Nakamurella panacisegetis]|uniref:Formate-dependent nitrite reductase, membrane component NrfD n=1 Tax=Nakamurella panacisegetis TaxID=1090615 RepID=A0A1H0RH82_9ACTN|nr:NrfD/PsrC family molybdoenzyme membrane anchor subunit [Nakamurella panacisegetis]SDP28874.1 Formate-dependent nitrite reductase, membrane component NrfD [Nakamurella panacisegetis]
MSSPPDDLTAARAGIGARRENGSRRDGKGRRRGGRGGGERKMVPDAVFTSYYGRPVVKASPWEADIPAYLFLGGLAAGSSLLAAGAELTGLASLRRTGRLGATVGIGLSFAALVHDLGRPERFVNMLRVAKHTSPMSVGTWILTGYGPLAGLAGAAEIAAMFTGVPAPLRRVLTAAARPAGWAAGLAAPAVASYTAVLLSDTATPSWHEAHRELPFVFVGSAAAASGGLGLIGATLADAGPARRLAVGGAVLELLAEHLMEPSMGLAAEPLHRGTAGRLMRTSKTLTVVGAVAAAVGHRNRVVSALAGLSLLAGSACTRFGIFHAGQESARDPKYTVVPQRERLDARES